MLYLQLLAPWQATATRLAGMTIVRTKQDPSPSPSFLDQRRRRPAGRLISCARSRYCGGVAVEFGLVVLPEFEPLFPVLPELELLPMLPELLPMLPELPEVVSLLVDELFLRCFFLPEVVPD